MMPRFPHGRTLFMAVVIVLIAAWPVFQRNDAAGDGCDNNRTTRAQKFPWNADGTPVRQWSWLNNNCQQWRLQPA